MSRLEAFATHAHKLIPPYIAALLTTALVYGFVVGLIKAAEFSAPSDRGIEGYTPIEATPAETVGYYEG